MHTLLLSCRKAAELVERQSFAPLPTRQAVQLWMHTRICAGCNAFQRQSRLIDTLLEKRGGEFVPVPTGSLEQRIIAAVESNKPNPPQAS